MPKLPRKSLELTAEQFASRGKFQIMTADWVAGKMHVGWTDKSVIKEN